MTFYEIIDSLVDVTKVPLEKQKGPKYDVARKDIHDNLITIEDVRAACYHEAGHFIYATTIGFKYGVDVSGFQILGPHIGYDLATDTYDATTMAIYTPGLHVKVPHTSDGVLDIAQIAVAGGESVEDFKKKLNKPMWKRGGADDRKRFECFAVSVRNRVGSLIDPPHIYWQDATTEAQKHFALKLYNSDIEREATIAMLQLFPSVFLNTKETQ